MSVKRGLKKLVEKGLIDKEDADVFKKRLYENLRVHNDNLTNDLDKAVNEL